MIIKPLELDNCPEKRFDINYPTAHEIRKNNDLIELTEHLSLSEVSQAIDERKEEEGTIINQRILPNSVLVIARPERPGSPGRKTREIEMPGADTIWTYGDHIKIIGGESFTKAEEEGFSFHKATEAAMLNADPDKPYRGIFLMSPYGREPKLFPIIFDIQGCEYAYFWLNFPEKFKQRMLNPALSKIENYGNKSTVYVGSRSTLGKIYQVEIFKLATRGGSKHADQLRTRAYCNCKHATVTRLHERFSHPELISCAHSVFALAVDENGRKEAIKEAAKIRHEAEEIEKNLYQKALSEEERWRLESDRESAEIYARSLENRSPVVLESTIYKPAGKLVRFKDKLQRKTVIRDNGRLRKLSEIEMEELLESRTISYVKRYGYDAMLNLPRLTADLVVVKQNPYSFR